MLWGKDNYHSILIITLIHIDYVYICMYLSLINRAVGNSWFVSALGVLSAHPHLLEKVIPKWSMQDWNHSEEPGKQLGMYNFRDTERHPGNF